LRRLTNVAADKHFSEARLRSQLLDVLAAELERYADPTLEGIMIRYEKVSGVFFGLIAIAQFVRALRALPAQVGTLQIPVWWSWLACLVTASLTVWAFRSANRKAAD